MSAARKISRLAIGDPATRPVVQTYKIPKYVLQDDRMSEDLPFRSRGGIAIRHHFPRGCGVHHPIRLQRNAGSSNGHFRRFWLRPNLTIDLRLDGKRVQRIHSRRRRGGAQDPGRRGRGGCGPGSPHPSAGRYARGWCCFPEPDARNLKVCFSRPVTDYSNALSCGTADAEPAIGNVTDCGALQRERNREETPSRRRIFVCRPSGSNDELPCARQDSLHAGAPRVSRTCRRPGPSGFAELSTAKAGAGPGVGQFRERNPDSASKNTG